MQTRNSFKAVRRILAIVPIVAVTCILTSSTATNPYKILHVFTCESNPTGSLVRDAAGNLYGTTESGGGSGCNGGGCGVVWKLAPNAGGTWTLSILHAFNGADGAFPIAGVVADAAGNLYGTTSGGGSGGCDAATPGCGLVWKLGRNADGTWTYSVLHDFANWTDGEYPTGPLIFDTAGNLYGTTVEGGSYGGTVFKLTPNQDGTWTKSVVYIFCTQVTCPDGALPWGGLVLDAAGNLYGTTYSGGAGITNGFGTVFKLTPNPGGTWTESVLYKFCSRSNCTDGYGPPAAVTFDAAGSLYGTTFGGGYGTVFKLTPNTDGTWTESVLHAFSGAADGCHPSMGALVFDAAGNLYGTTTYGGSTPCWSSGKGLLDGYGVVFKLAPASGGWRETVLHTFLGVGQYPSGVLLDPAGNLYGTTSSGNNNHGLVYEITP